MSSSVESTPVLQSVLRRVTESSEFRRLAAQVASGARVVSVAGLTSAAARALALAALQRETGRRFAVMVAANRDMEAWERDLSFWCGAPGGVECFGDTVDSIRRFDPETQLSIEQLKETEVVPMRELAVARDDFRLWAEFARDRWADETHARALKDRTVYADEGETFPGWEWLIPLVVKTDASAFDYLTDAVLAVDEPAGIEQHLAQSFETVAARFAENESAGEIGLKPEELYLTVEELRGRIDNAPRLELRALGRAAAVTDERS